MLILRCRKELQSFRIQKVQINKSPLIQEIQGLRGISILAVMLFHFGVSALPGGYTGVDMFFVISGFVITRLIYNEHAAQTFTLGRFYKNRVVRLLPNLLAMILATIVISYFVLRSYDFFQYAKSLQFSGVYLTNMVFARQQGYFDPSREVKPLLHTWSLSIEEQFYLFFPLLLILLFKLRHYKFRILVFLLLISFAEKYWSIEHDAINSFFSFPGRIWEFMIGALTALAPGHIKERLKSNAPLSWAALLLIALSFLLLDEKLPYAGLLVGLPCLGTAILIFSSAGTPVGALLSSGVLVFLGAMSYSLYLWHWPILVLLRNSDLQLSLWQQLPVLLAATALVSWLTWRYIETPFHLNKNIFRGKQVALVTVTFTVFCGVAGGYIYSNRGFENRFPEWVSVRENLDGYNFEKATGVKTNPLVPCLLKGTESSHIASCALFGKARGQHGMLILGDSHVSAWYPAFDMVAQQKNIQGIYASLPGCPPLFGVHSDDLGRNMCEKDLELKVVNLLDSYPIQTVYLIANWAMYSEGNYMNGILQRPTHFISNEQAESLDAASSKAVMESALAKTVAFFRQRNIEVVIVLGVPILPRAIQDLPVDYTMPLVEYHKQNSFMENMAEKMREIDGVRTIKPSVYLCAGETCLTRKDGNVLYKDNNHISPAGAAFLAPLIANSQ